MNYLYEESDFLNRPYEAFVYDTKRQTFPVVRHWHHYVELIYITEGSILVNSNEREFCLKQDDMFLFHSGDVHSIYGSSEEKAKYLGLKFDVGRLAIKSSYTPRFAFFLKKVRGIDPSLSYFSSAETTKRDIVSRFLTVKKELDEQQIGYDVRVHAEISSILVDIVRMWTLRGVNLDVTDVVINDDEITLRSAMEYMDSHLTTKITVASLANRCNMSYSHFAKRFKEVYGRSCKDQLELLRIEKAEEMLKMTDASLNEISQELCFSDCSHFIRTFKKWKGVTPGKYRK